MSNKKIVLVGGPCGGKTTTVLKLINKLKNDYLISSTEEIAGALLGLGYLDEYPISSYDFQNILFKMQFINEYNKEQQSEILICDRGIFDAQAYLTPIDFSKIIFENKVDAKQIMQTYDAALYFRTIGYEFPEQFKQERIYETPESAIQRDKLSLRIWKEKLLETRYSNYDGFDKKQQIIYDSLIRFLETQKEVSPMLSDYYESYYVDSMLNDIRETLEANNIPKSIKERTLRLIK